MKDARMKHIERMTRLVGSVATQVVFIDGIPEKIEQKKKIIKVMNSSILNSLKDRSKFLK